MTTRRSFTRNAIFSAGASWLAQWNRAFAQAAEDPSVGKPWSGWKPGQFQIHFIYTGVAESMFHIFPDGTTLLLDCGDHPACKRGKLAVPILPDQSRHAGEWIARYVERVNPAKRAVDYLMVSHFHDDHTGGESWHAGKTEGRGEDYYLSGFGQAAETLTFKTAIDRGWPDYNDPIPHTSPELTNMRKLYAYLQKRDGLTVEKFRIGDTRQVAMKKDPARFPTFTVQNICANGKILMKDGSIRDLYAGFKGNRLNENGMSLGMIVRYGPFAYYTAGDFSDNVPSIDGRPRFQIEDAQAEAVGPVHVSKINHHGHYSMPAKLVSALRSRVWISCVWDQLHNVDPVMARLADRTLYPGERLICPGIMPAERRAVDNGKPWMNDVAKASYEGVHTILTVEPEGKAYTVTLLSAKDEAMTVQARFPFTV
ncbi:MAG: MBL fold metallo-hydrolase [Kiritimatiellae bacterium]|nr:MBL fold metallo-hydrolase [Kiritimatiellia bacterium]MBP5226331.1 MBL fold metallo-hydrolase [Kiritimatiellia bacterium]